MRINRYISQSGIASRRNAELIIKEGRVSINGEIVTNFATKVSETDVVLLDGKKLPPPLRRIVIAFHKQPGILCTAYDPFNRQIIYDCLPSGFKSLKYIGRLDLQSRGLVLLSNDGDLVNRLTHPKFQVERSYMVWTDRQISRSAAQAMLNGVDIGKGEVGRIKDMVFCDGFVELILTEGKNREIRRILETLGYEILDLKRVSYANIKLGDLPAGNYREITGKELEELYNHIN